MTRALSAQQTAAIAKLFVRVGDISKSVLEGVPIGVVLYKGVFAVRDSDGRLNLSEEELNKWIQTDAAGWLIENDTAQYYDIFGEDVSFVLPVPEDNSNPTQNPEPIKSYPAPALVFSTKHTNHRETLKPEGRALRYPIAERDDPRSILESRRAVWIS